MIKIAYIEDSPNIREFISDYFIASPEFDFVVASESVEDFLDEIQLLPVPEVILCDISLPGMSGLEAIRHIKNLLPNVEIIMFTIHDDSDRIFKALCAGASGFLLKNTPTDKLKESIYQVYRGEAAMSPSIARKVFNYFNPKKKNKVDLTEREQQVIQGMVEGLSAKMIADKLMVSVNTISFHTKNIYKKLQVNSKAEVIAKSLKGEL